METLKTEEQLRAEFKALKVEYSYGCYRENNAEVCDNLGMYFELIEPDLNKALDVYKMNCLRNKFGKSCHAYASFLLVGRATPKNEKEASEVFEKGCEYGFGESCYMSGYSLMGVDKSLKGVIEPNPKKAIEEWKKGCNQKNASCCSAAASIYSQGRYGIEKNLPKCFNYSLKACELNHIPSCKNVAVMYKKGDGVHQDDEKAEFYKAKVLDAMEDLKSEGLYNMEMYTDKKNLWQRIKGVLGLGSKSS